MKKYIYLLLVLFIFACHEEEAKADKIKPAFIFRGGSVVLDSCPSEYLFAVYNVSEIEFVDVPGFAVVPDNEEMYEIVGQMAVVGYNPVFLVDDFQFSEKLVKRFEGTTFFTNKKLGENSVVVRFNSREINYLAGVFACLATKTHKFAYVGSDTVSNEAFVNINSFMLGAKSIDKNASTKWVKINKAGEQFLSEQVSVLKENDFDLIFVSEKNKELEEMISSLKLPFVGYYGEKSKNQLAYFSCDYGMLWKNVMEDFCNNKLEKSYEYGFKENSIKLSRYRERLSADDMGVFSNTTMEMGTVDIFIGPIFDNEGFLRVPAGEKISDENLKSVNWLIRGIK